MKCRSLPPSPHNMSHFFFIDYIWKITGLFKHINVFKRKGELNFKVKVNLVSQDFCSFINTFLLVSTGAS